MKKNRKMSKSTVITILVLLSMAVIAGGIKLTSYVSANSNHEKINVSKRALNDDFFNSMNEKELIHYKMLNSIYSVDTVKAKINDMAKGAYNEDITYITDIKNKKSYSSTIDNSTKENKETIISNNIPIEFDNIQKTYKEFRQEEDIVEYEESYIRLLKPSERYKDNRGYYINNQFAFLGYGSDTIFGNTVVDKLSNYDNWNIVKETTYLNRQCIEVSIKMEKSNQGDNLDVIVDKETGIILERKSLMGQSDVRMDIKVVELEINPTIDSKIFEKDKSEYTKQ